MGDVILLVVLGFCLLVLALGQVHIERKIDAIAEFLDERDVALHTEDSSEGRR